MHPRGPLSCEALLHAGPRPCRGGLDMAAGWLLQCMALADCRLTTLPVRYCKGEGCRCRWLLGSTLTCPICVQEALKAEYYLWQLYQIERDMAGARAEAAAKQASLHEAGRALHAKEAALEERRRAAAGVAKERLLLERRHKKRKAELEKKVQPGCCSLRTAPCCRGQDLNVVVFPDVHVVMNP